MCARPCWCRRPDHERPGPVAVGLPAKNQMPPAAYARKGPPTTDQLRMVNNDHISELFLAATEAVEEAIINALLAADTVEGNGHSVPGLDAATLLQAPRSAGCPGV
ncbi:P1 family peptidase [Pseudomonas sp. Pse1]|uniref:P1 family peptidase n=1 Tax=Pseudomonas sp. Pse1 TaxID=2926020 RepID=UPI0021173FF6|nr:P1 family peptidase [Pseudomonas sp. Pse1]